MVNGGSLTDDLRTKLLMLAQSMMKKNERKIRLSLKEHSVKGWLETGFKYGIMGAVGGFIFDAEFESKGQDFKVNFIARPTKKPDILSKGKWIKAPLFPVSKEDLARN